MSLPQWKGLFDWSMKYQDGTKPSEWDPSDYSPEKMRWLEDVLKHYMQDFAKRMTEIKAALETGVGKGAQDPDHGTPQEQQEKSLGLRDKELLLEELMDIVSSIDFARDLHKVGGLSTLLSLLTCDAPSLRWRAAEVVATCVQNNPPVQTWFLDGGVMPLLMAGLTTQGSTDDLVLVRVKALLAMSGLVRHHRPSLTAAVSSGVLPVLASLVKDSDVRVKRKSYSLLQYILSQRPDLTADLCSSTDALSTAAQQLQQSSSSLHSSLSKHEAEDSDVNGHSMVIESEVRTAALTFMYQTGQHPQGWDALKRLDQLPSLLSTHQSYLSKLAPEDKECMEEEIQTVHDVQCMLSGARPAAVAQVVSDHVDENDQEMGEKTIRLKPSEQQQQTGSSQGLGLMAVQKDLF